MNQTNPIKGLSALGFATVLLFLISFLIPEASPFLILSAGVQSMAAYWGLLWALPRSNYEFFLIFASDALLKLAGLAVAVYWLGSRHYSYTGPLLSLGFAFLFLSLIQIPFFCRVK